MKTKTQKPIEDFNREQMTRTSKNQQAHQSSTQPSLQPSSLAREVLTNCRLLRPKDLLEKFEFEDYLAGKPEVFHLRDLHRWRYLKTQNLDGS